MHKQTKIYNPNELYIAKLSDLIVFKIYDLRGFLTADIEGNMYLSEIRFYTHLISNIKKINLPIILRWNEAKGQKYLEDTLTGTKINVITAKDDARWKCRQELMQCISENIAHIETLCEFNTNDKKMARIYLSEAQNTSELNKIHNSGKLSLSIDLENVKPISKATKEEQISLLEYRDENNPSLNERKMVIESLKQIQAQEISPFIPSAKVKEPKEMPTDENDAIKQEFDTFVDEYKAKQKTLKKNK